MTNKRHLSAGETETVWNYSRYHIGDWIEMYSTDSKILRQYEKFSLEHPEHCKLLKEDAYSMTFSIDPKCLGVKPRAPRKAPPLSEEQKKANGERLAQLRKKKQAQD